MIYAGIDEAGYGPMVGPMVVARSAFALPGVKVADAIDQAWQLAPDCCLWQRLQPAICKTAAEHRKTHRLPVNDSKKLNTKSAGLRHLEAACLSFMTVANAAPTAKLEHLGDWLAGIGSTRADFAETLWWYATTGDHGRPWEMLPVTEALTKQQIALAANMLNAACNQGDVTMPEPLNAAVVWADTFNRMARATRSKAAVNFHHVAKNLVSLVDAYADHELLIVVDRQGGRTHYREQLAQAFANWDMTVLVESHERSGYRLQSHNRTATILFTISAEEQHMPVALASMTAKYTRELLMHRFNAWFTKQWPDIEPTKGYGSDGKRFVQEIRPRLPEMNIDADQVIRCL